MQFLIKNDKNEDELYFFLLQFSVIKTLNPEPDPYPDSLEMLDPEPQPDSMIRIHNTAWQVRYPVAVQRNAKNNCVKN